MLSQNQCIDVAIFYSLAYCRYTRFVSVRI